MSFFKKVAYHLSPNAWDLIPKLGKQTLPDPFYTPEILTEADALEVLVDRGLVEKKPKGFCLTEAGIHLSVGMRECMEALARREAEDAEES